MWYQLSYHTKFSIYVRVRKFRDTAWIPWIQIWEFLSPAILAHFLTRYHFPSEGRSRTIGKSLLYYEYTHRELPNAITLTPCLSPEFLNVLNLA
jgi:hypothetical protein